MTAVWMIKQDIAPGGSIMIVLALPVLLFGVVLTIIGLAKRDLFEDSYKHWLVKNYGKETGPPTVSIERPHYSFDTQ